MENGDAYEMMSFTCATSFPKCVPAPRLVILRFLHAQLCQYRSHSLPIRYEQRRKNPTNPSEQRGKNVSVIPVHKSHYSPLTFSSPGPRRPKKNANIENIMGRPAHLCTPFARRSNKPVVNGAELFAAIPHAHWNFRPPSLQRRCKDGVRCKDGGRKFQ